MDVVDRSARLRARLAEAGCDALLVTNVTNIRYLTGFTGSAALLLVTPDRLVFVTDGRYRDQAAAQLAAAGVEADIEIGRTADEQRTLLTGAAAGVRRLGLESEAVTWGQQRRFATEWFPDAELVPTEGLVEELRRVKDAGESPASRRRAIADAALRAPPPRRAADRGRVASSSSGRCAGSARGPSFDTIVAAGPNGAMPHHRAGSGASPRRPRRHRLRGAGRRVPLGHDPHGGGGRDLRRAAADATPSPRHRKRGVAAVRAGVAAKVVDEACRAVRRDAGLEEAFLHGTGHGVGLDIHEAPRVSANAPGTLADGHVVTVEPGVYLPEHGGVRIEDTVVATAEGCRTLTLAPKDPTL